MYRNIFKKLEKPKTLLYSINALIFLINSIINAVEVCKIYINSNNPNSFTQNEIHCPIKNHHKKNLFSTFGHRQTWFRIINIRLTRVKLTKRVRLCKGNDRSVKDI